MNTARIVLDVIWRCMTEDVLASLSTVEWTSTGGECVVSSLQEGQGHRQGSSGSKEVINYEQR